MNQSKKKRETSQIRVPKPLFAKLKIRAYKLETTLSKHAESVLENSFRDDQWLRKMNIKNK